ncbi:Peptide methionine sulfoxide reductase MsrA 2 [Beijerinckiaceae bacterium RH AL1]|nr:peptide-methionine (S)-S-oxide reductase MsrA [Beijerinckiaceae bacterium]VVB42091.1 Peptide methionine sulfoxide reductase MsrA 2 [Beijerinckiaceae bacterium RH AL8]VVB42092.1 Peptide methionine sulfoxide reductase MsrA 2 [Beijerinckiaceae bacterium RH CH11]VVC53133.1 Peptide methionine sulfoxide reductase MsrA 2 [Beijerinckiaceae bacterium RH AL1]
MSLSDRSKTALAATAALAFVAAAFWPQTRASAEDMQVVPAPKVDVPANGNTATAVLAGGCFWGVQGVFQHVKGVKDAVSGYSGGSKMTASYPVVSTGTTGHAETVKITYDPSEVSYGKLLQIYFSVVTDPTTLNAQGPDEGTQYRSNIFPTTPEQEKVAKAYIQQLQAAHVFRSPIVTKVTAFKAFYPAEGYHQNYLTLHPEQGYIAANDIPKVEGLKRLFPQEWKQGPVLTATN